MSQLKAKENGIIFAELFLMFLGNYITILSFDFLSLNTFEVSIRIDYWNLGRGPVGPGLTVEMFGVQSWRYRFNMNVRIWYSFFN